MRRLAALLALGASVTQDREGSGMERTLTLPHPLKAGTNAYLQVRVGPLAPGERIRVTTHSGEPIGTIAPFGPTERRQAGVYSLPVPSDTIHEGALSLRVTVVRSNAPGRAPTATEVQDLRLLAPDAPQ